MAPAAAAPNKAMNIRARRKVVVRYSLCTVSSNRVSDSSNGVQQRSIEFLVYLCAQARDMDVDYIRLGIEVIIPDMLQQHGTSYHAACIFHQILKQAKFTRLQENQLPRARHLVRKTIKLKVSNNITGRGFLGRVAPCQRLNAG